MSNKNALISGITFAGFKKYALVFLLNKYKTCKHQYSVVLSLINRSIVVINNNIQGLPKKQGFPRLTNGIGLINLPRTLKPWNF